MTYLVLCETRQQMSRYCENLKGRMTVNKMEDVLMVGDDTYRYISNWQYIRGFDKRETTVLFLLGWHKNSHIYNNLNEVLEFVTCTFKHYRFLHV